MAIASGFTCPICGWPSLHNNPLELTYEICPQCGVEFGYNERRTWSNIRLAWIAAGRPFWRNDGAWGAKLVRLERELKR